MRLERENPLAGTITMATEGYIVHWAENPLASKIVLDDYGRLRLRYGIALDNIMEAKVTMQLAKDDKDLSWLDKCDAFTEEEGSYVKEIDRIFAWAEQELQGVHCGDCTHVPCPCMKCHAEGYLGFYTTKGLNGAGGHNAQEAFQHVKTLAEAIQRLNKRPITAIWEGWEAHVPRWTKEHEQTVAWLENYGREHNFLISRQAP